MLCVVVCYFIVMWFRLMIVWTLWVIDIGICVLQDGEEEIE